MKSYIIIIVTIHVQCSKSSNIFWVPMMVWRLLPVKLEGLISCQKSSMSGVNP